MEERVGMMYERIVKLENEKRSTIGFVISSNNTVKFVYFRW